jgi:O-methyltransferase domain/Dimerisation domain
MDPSPSVEQIDQLAFGFLTSKVLLSAIELGLFTELAKGPLNAEQLRMRLGLHPRSVRDFLDTLVALGLLKRREEYYQNTLETDFYLDSAKPTYVGGLYEMFNTRLYAFTGSLTEGLRTGKPQNEIKAGEDIFSAIYGDPQKLRGFLKAMTGATLPSAKAMAAKFPWRDYRTFIDVGCAQGGLPVQIAVTHPHLSGGGFDLDVVRPIFEEYVESFGLRERLRFHAGDFMKDALPGADVLVMGHILHDWNIDEKRMLLRKAYDALPNGGALIVYERLIDDERKRNIAGLLESLLMLIETQGGFDYTGADCREWMREAGFSETRVEQLTGVESMVVGIK